MARQTVLIVKTGQSETFDAENNYIISLGDVLRTTPILHAFPPEEYELTWLTEKDAIPLLADNPYIHKLMIVTPFSAAHLLHESFDIVVNLERDQSLCSIIDRVPARRHYGFRYQRQSIGAYDHADRALEIIASEETKKTKTQSWAELLYQMLGKEYAGHGAILGYKPNATAVYDVGLNHLAGEKFPLKKWPRERWDALAVKLLTKTISWQAGTNNLRDYMEWIASCKLIVTNDSLGLHIALALGRRVVALFGPTYASEVPDNPLLTKIVAMEGNMANITVQEVYEHIK